MTRILALALAAYTVLAILSDLSYRDALERIRAIRDRLPPEPFATLARASLGEVLTILEESDAAALRALIARARR